MDLVIKVYDNYRSNGIKDQIFIKSKIEIDEELGNFGTAQFDVTGLSLIEYNRVEVYEAGSTDTLIFKGLAYEPTKEVTTLTNKTNLVCRDERAIMLDRKVLYERSKTDTIANIVSELLLDYNSLGESWTSQIDLDKTVSIEYRVGDIYAGVFDELALQGGGYRAVKDGEIIMKELLGENRTFGGNFLEVIFDRTQDSNVSEIEIVGQSTRSNIVIGVDADGNTHRETDIVGGIIYGISVESFRNGDLVDKTQQLLARRNIRQKILKLSLDPNKFIDANIGDKLMLRVENVNDLEDISGEVLVIKREIEYNLGRKVVNITVGENIIEEDSFGNIIMNIKKEVDQLKI